MVPWYTSTREKCSLLKLLAWQSVGTGWQPVATGWLTVCGSLQILMSATFNASMFSDYFGKCPVIQVPGFTHPVSATALPSLGHCTCDCIHCQEPK